MSINICQVFMAIYILDWILGTCNLHFGQIVAMHPFCKSSQKNDGLSEQIYNKLSRLVMIDTGTLCLIRLGAISF